MWEILWKITKCQREITFTWLIDFFFCKNRKGIIYLLWCVPKDRVGNLLLKNRCSTHFWYISNIIFCRENCNISLICIIARLSPTCIILSFVYFADKLHLASSLPQQPWRSPHLEELCSPSFSLASKKAYRKKEPACNCSDLQPQKTISAGRKRNRVAC